MSIGKIVGKIVGILVLIVLWLVFGGIVSLAGGMKLALGMFIVALWAGSWVTLMSAIRQYRTMGVVTKLADESPVALGGLADSAVGKLSGPAKPARGLADDVLAPFTTDPVVAATFHIDKIKRTSQGSHTNAIHGKYAPPSIISVPGDEVLCWTGESGLPDRTRSTDDGFFGKFVRAMTPGLPEAMVLPAGSTWARNLGYHEEPGERIRSLRDAPGGSRTHYEDDDQAKFQYRQTTIPEGTRVTVVGEVTRVADASLPDEALAYCREHGVEYVVQQGSAPLLLLTDRDETEVVGREERQVLAFYAISSLSMAAGASLFWYGHEVAAGGVITLLVVIILVGKMTDLFATPAQSQFRL